MLIEHSSVFPASAQAVYARLQQSETLQSIVKPVLTFQPTIPFPARWQAGVEVNLRPHLFGLIPTGDHFVRFAEVDDARLCIKTHEHGGPVEKWEHTMQVEPLSATTSRYTDSVDIEAGNVTKLVCFLALRFYRHRHCQLQQLLQQEHHATT